MQRPVDARRRWFGLLFLILAVVMLVWGQTWLKPHLHGGGYVCYWLVCMVLTWLAVAIAWLDLRSIRRRQREQQRALINRALQGLEDASTPEQPPPGPNREQREAPPLMPRRKAP
jgi:type VI protein secretion system component VasK